MSQGEDPAARPARSEQDTFRRAAGRFATGVAVTTSVVDDVPVGTTVSAITTVSLEPRLLLTCLQRSSRLLAAIERSGVFAVTMLAADQQQHARWFANPLRPTGIASFGGVPTLPAPVTGCLLLHGGLAYFDCALHEIYPGGDHTIVLGRVAAHGELRPGAPLIFINGHYTTLDHWAPAPDGRGLDVASSERILSTTAKAWSVTTRR